MRTDQPLEIALSIAEQPLGRIRQLPLVLLTLTVLAVVPVARPALAQADAAKTTAPVAKKPALHAHKHAKPAVATPTATAKPPAPVVQEPPKPDWPVNSKPNPAAISWDASGLRIQASNSSLEQILKEVTTLTGATVEGLGQDERVFGVYGPGPAREVLARLFYGSSYNILLIGDQGQGTPRQILLTSRDGKAVAKAPNGGAQEDDADDVEQDDQPQEPQPPPQQPPVRPINPLPPDQNGGPHSPQQAIQQRQQ
jgi:hypothetical protein